MKRLGTLLSCAAVLVRAEGPSTEAPQTDGIPPKAWARRRSMVRDDVAGVSIEVPSDWRVQQDPVLFNTYGFALFDPGGADERADMSARRWLASRWRMRCKPDQIEGLVQDLMSKYQRVLR